jgi:hypothetical protein
VADNLTIIKAAISRQHDLDHERFLMRRIKNIINNQNHPSSLFKELYMAIDSGTPFGFTNKLPEKWFKDYIEEVLAIKRPELSEKWKLWQRMACMAGIPGFPLLYIELMEGEESPEKESVIQDLVNKYSEAKADFVPVVQQRCIAKELFEILKNRSH